MKKTKFINSLFLMLSFMIIACLFTSCAKNNVQQNSVTNNSAYPPSKTDNPQKLSVLEPSVMKDTHIKPDTSAIEAPKASTSITQTADTDTFIKSLTAFMNPNGNEYDAFSILGDFRRVEKGEELLKIYKEASKVWHEPIVQNVGEKCLVDVQLLSVENYDLSNAVVTEWNGVNGKTAQDFANVQCMISTNYCSDSLTYSFDIVKSDGNWYLANTGTLNKLQSIITTEIYK